MGVKINMITLQNKVLFKNNYEMTTTHEQLNDLKEIRSLMERSSRFIGLSGLSGIAAGFCALAGASVPIYISMFDHSNTTIQHVYIMIML